MKDFGPVFAVVGVFYVVVVAVMIVAWVKILGKAGYSGWWVLIGVVPVVNVVMFLVFAFSKWPVTRENERLTIALTPPTTPPRPQVTFGDQALPPSHYPPPR